MEVSERVVRNDGSLWRSSQQSGAFRYQAAKSHRYSLPVHFKTRNSIKYYLFIKKISFKLIFFQNNNLIYWYFHIKTWCHLWKFRSFSVNFHASSQVSEATTSVFYKGIENLNVSGIRTLNKKLKLLKYSFLFLHDHKIWIYHSVTMFKKSTKLKPLITSQRMRIQSSSLKKNCWRGR